MINPGGVVMRPKAIVIILLIVLFLILTIQNTEAVTLQFLFWKTKISRIILIPLFALIGFLIGYVTAKLEKPKSRKESKKEDPQN